MRVGTMFFGTVDEIEGQSIQTKFFVIGMPLFPVSSYVVLQETVEGVQGFEIAPHPKSVIMGYIRVWMMAPMGVAFFYWMLEDASWIWMALVAALWVVLTFFVGGLGAKAKLDRTVLGQVTGFFVAPELLPPDTMNDVLTSLQERWLTITTEFDLLDWESIRQQPELALQVAPLVHALHRYSKAAEGSDEWAAADTEAMALLAD